MVAGRVEIKNVCKSFPQNQGGALVVLENISLTFEGGEFISLIGHSGCGKSTLLRLVAGLMSQDSGTITLDGVEITKPGYERGFVFQDPTLFPWLTIYENLAYGLRARGVYAAEKHRIPDFFKLVGLEGFEKSYPHHLSGGMAQRAALARALVNMPKVLLLDEPLGALDAITRMIMQDELITIWQKQKMTAVMVTHDVDEAIYMANRIIIMSSQPAPRPARIEKIITVDKPYPRKRDDRDFIELRMEILRILHFAGGKNAGGTKEY